MGGVPTTPGEIVGSSSFPGIRAVNEKRGEIYHPIDPLFDPSNTLTPGQLGELM